MRFFAIIATVFSIMYNVAFSFAVLLGLGFTDSPHGSASRILVVVFIYLVIGIAYIISSFVMIIAPRGNYFKWSSIVYLLVVLSWFLVIRQINW